MLSSDRKQLIKKFLEQLEIDTDDYGLFDEALTHPSYNKDLGADKGYDYERLEYLGDSVLRLFAGQYLYEKHPDYNEGQLTKIRSVIVSDKFLAGIADKLEYYNYIDVSTGEERENGQRKESVLACAFEAVLGAVYLASGFERAKEFVYSVYEEADINNLMHYYNAKEILQEYTQRMNKDLPNYKIISESGPAHDKVFEAAVLYHRKTIGTGKGKTKKEAEQAAAKNAIERFNIQDNENF